MSHACLLALQGGIKAVIWTDVFQVFVMYAGMLAILIKVKLKGLVCSGTAGAEIKRTPPPLGGSPGIEGSVLLSKPVVATMGSKIAPEHLTSHSERRPTTTESSSWPEYSFACCAW